MKNRYILDPSGKIKKIDSDNKTTNVSLSLGDFNNIDTSYEFQDEVYKDMSHFANSDGEYHETYFSESGRRKEELLKTESFTEKIKYLINNDKSSFGFINDKNIPQFNSTFKQLNSFLNTDTGNTAEGTDVIPFVDEFEFYTGVRQIISSDDNPELLESSIVFIFDYLADVAIEAAIAEALMLINKLDSSNSKEGNRLDGLNKKHIDKEGSNKKLNKLVLGEYILDEVDVFSRYFFEVLNYPLEEGKVIGEGAGFYFLKRLSCYFIGMTEWVIQDKVIDWQRLIEKSTGDKIFDNIPTGKDISFDNLGNNMSVLLLSVVEIFLNSFLNSAGLKRMMMLLKKFHTQRYWVNTQLYSAKRKTYENVIIDSFNYYYFKFFIERVNVGIKIWNRSLAKDSVKNLTKNSTNRLKGELYNKGSSDTINYRKEVYEAKSAETQNAVVESQQVNQETAAQAAEIANDDASYNFSYNFNDFSLSNIPTALMFNKSFKSLKIKNEKNVSDSKFFAKTEKYRLPIKLVNKIEERLESEYMPFYFHDIRTNEILSFHAFIENISDSYTPEYTSTGGFGRIDDVKAYVKTTRSISLSFTIAAMNKEDHNTMWYYINKLVTMVYPQWTKGEELVIDDTILEQPFSQVPGNSPLIRLRIGDVIKNNYSRLNLERIFGLSDTSTKEYDFSLIENDEKFLFNSNNDFYNITISDFDILNPKFISEEFSYNNATYYFLSIELQRNDKSGSIKFYKIPLLESIGPYDYIYKSTNNLNLHSFDTYLELIVNTNQSIQASKKLSEYKTNDSLFAFLLENKFIIETKDTEYTNLKNRIMRPFDSEGNINNPITQSYESGMSKGLAGHITQLDLNYNDSVWEIDQGAKAPMMVKVTMSFAPIHDIPPGLDYKGMPRAANYNIGSINNAMFGDPLQKYKGEK